MAIPVSPHKPETYDRDEPPAPQPVRRVRRTITIQFPTPGIEGAPLENVHGCYSEGLRLKPSRSVPNVDAETGIPRKDNAYFVGGWRGSDQTSIETKGTRSPSTHTLAHQMSQIQISRAPSKPRNLARTWERLRDYFLGWVETWDTQILSSALKSTQPNSVVNSIALTVWAMQMYKRRLRYLWNERLHDVVEILTVPPVYTANINRYLTVNGDIPLRQEDLTTAREILRDLWSVVRHSENAEPKAVLVIGQHATDKSRWVVHKYVTIPAIFQSESNRNT